MDVVIAGAGIAGLTTALCLSRAGHAVHLIERSPEFLDVGAGLQCGANAIRVMQHLSLIKPLMEFSVQPERVEFRDFRTGAQLHNFDLGESYRKKYGAPYLHLHRSDLQRTLVDSFLGSKAGTLTMGAAFESYHQEHNKVYVNFSGGRQLEADLLIGADGIHSQVRDQMCGRLPARYTGNIAWRGIVSTEHLPEKWMDTVVTNFVGPNKHMVLYYLRKKKLVNFVGVVENKQWKNTQWSAKAPWEELKNDFDGWHPMVECLIHAVDKNECYRWALCDHPPLHNWTSNRVTLIGDAAHATLPFMASGAAMAIEDGRVLQRSLDQCNSVEEALKLYQRNRYVRTSQVQRSSMRAGKLYHFKSSFMRKAAFKAFEKIGARQQAFLPSYDANTVELI